MNNNENSNDALKLQTLPGVAFTDSTEKVTYVCIGKIVIIGS
jgi:hypothetical protein